MKEYGVYKGDILLCVGTIEECSVYMGVKKKTVKFYTTVSYRRRLEKRKRSNKAIEVILLEGD